jgi:predicted phage-related endonuclease
MTATTRPRVELPAEARNWIDAIRALETQIRALEDAKAKAREQVEHLLGDAEEGTIGGEPVVRWAWSKPVARVDVKALRADYPDIAEKVTVTGQPTRSFRLVDPA